MWHAFQQLVPTQPIAASVLICVIAHLAISSTVKLATANVFFVEMQVNHRMIDSSQQLLNFSSEPHLFRL
jgi:hypothetical protein